MSTNPSPANSIPETKKEVKAQFKTYIRAKKKRSSVALLRGAASTIRGMVVREKTSTPTTTPTCVSRSSSEENVPTAQVRSERSDPVICPGRPSICQKNLSEQQDLALSFSGCGFLGTYHFGVATCFIDNGQPLLARLRRIGGASAGSLVAALMVLAPHEVSHGLTTLYNLADELNSLKFGALSPGFYLSERLLKVVDEHLPEDVSVANNRLFVSVTAHKTRENKLFTEFTSREHLIKCLMSSCYIPMYSMGIKADPPEVDGVAYIDGGYSNNVPDFEDIRTVTVSPFSGEVDISPGDPSPPFDWKMNLANQQMKCNLRNIVRGAQALFPPSRAALHQYYTTGYKDAFKFLLEKRLLQRKTGTPV